MNKIKKALQSFGNTFLNIAGFCGSAVALMFMIVVCNFLNMVKIADILFSITFGLIFIGSNIGLYNFLRRWLGFIPSLVLMLLVSTIEIGVMFCIKHSI